jgi:hypothetical protein
MATKHVSLRLTPEMHNRLVDMAERKRRSLNGQIEWYLERGLDADGSPAPGKEQSPGFLNGYSDGRYELTHGDKPMTEDQLALCGGDYADGYRKGYAAARDAETTETPQEQKP